MVRENVRLRIQMRVFIRGITIAFALCAVHLLAAASDATSQEIAIAPHFPGVPGDFKAFNALGTDVVGKEEIAYRLYLTTLSGEQRQSFVVIRFTSIDTLYRGDLRCEVAWQIYRAGHLLGEKKLDLSKEAAVSLLNAIDRSEIFSLTAAQPAKRLPISGRLITAEQIDKDGRRIIDRCEGSSSPMAYIVNYLKKNIDPEL